MQKDPDIAEQMQIHCVGCVYQDFLMGDIVGRVWVDPLSLAHLKNGATCAVGHTPSLKLEMWISIFMEILSA